jgi:hypothetical protein
LAVIVVSVAVMLLLLVSIGYWLVLKNKRGKLTIFTILFEAVFISLFLRLVINECCSVLFCSSISLFSFNVFLFVLEFIIAKTLPPEILICNCV